MPDYYSESLKNTLLTNMGIATGPYSLMYWKTAIIHEAGHVINNDRLKRIALYTALPLLIHFGTKKVPFLHFLPMRFTTYRFMEKGAELGLGKYAEYQADYEIIKRVQDPQALEVTSFFYKNIQEIRKIDREQAIKSLQKMQNELERHATINVMIYKILLQTKKKENAPQEDIDNKLQKIEQLLKDESQIKINQKQDIKQLQEVQSELARHLTINVTMYEILLQIKKREEVPQKEVDNKLQETEQLLEKERMFYKLMKENIINIERTQELYERYPWLEEFKDIHPRDAVRSEYFKKAAENLRNK